MSTDGLVAFARATLSKALGERTLNLDKRRRTHALIVLQSADGSWDLTPDLALVLERDFDDLRSAVDRTGGPREIVHRVWATALAVAFLERFAPGARQEWDMLARKARMFIDNAGIAAPGEPTWIGAARKFLDRGFLDRGQTTV